jgi:adenylate cyclase
VLVSVQKAVEDSDGRFVGVIRAGILAAGIDGIANLRVNESDAADPHRVFLADSEGRLVTRLAPGDRLELRNDTLRVHPAQLPRPIELALKSEVLRKARGDERSGELLVDGERYLITFRPLAATQDWLAGIVVPESAYTAELHRLRTRLATAIALVLALILIGGGLALAALRRGLGSIVAGAAGMRQLEFAPAEANATFRDVQEVLGSLEQAKTAMRALGKYVPVDLVRELWSQTREPVLGELRDLSILFTDLEGFTSLAEKLSPDELARRLGLYLQTMTEAIRSCGGTVDKFVGDAVMALWNAPTLRANHAPLACQAILRCRSATRSLYESEAWRGAPPLRTRFGLHRDRVMIGHFGAPDRLSYTAMGDGVNLAARLESLCKQYGVDAIVSGAAVEEAKGQFVFRLLDRVAVKGKTAGVLVYELLGAAGEEIPNLAWARAYELAFEAYRQRDFTGAIARLEQNPDDPPSGALLVRCRSLAERPPPPQWDGVHVAATK